MVRAGSGGSGAGNGGADYTYDGDGRRVRKAVYSGATTVFVYDAMGRLVADAVNIAHEGSHVADGSTLVAALPTDLTDQAAMGKAIYGPANTNMWNSEVKAYEVSGLVGQHVYPSRSLMFGPGNDEVWNPTWAQADRATKRTAGIERILTNPSGLYWNNPRLGKGYLED